MLDDSYREWYGLALSNACGLKTGTIYPALARLEQAGWVSSYWEDVDPSVVGRPKRRLYRLTGEGADAGEERLLGPAPALALQAEQEPDEQGDGGAGFTHGVQS